MKFGELALGARFGWQGRRYVKVGPLAARDEATGELRLIPRYALLTPLEAEEGSRASAAVVSLPAEEVRAAFERFRAECLEAIGPAPAEVLARIAEAGRRFYQDCGLNPD